MDTEATTLKVFCGYDKREAIGFHVFVQSLIERSSIPLEIIPLSGEQRDGTNAFIYARFLVPHLCNFQGRAIFLDASDMLMRADIAELVALFDDSKAVQVVQHDYQTRSPRKYIGTDMEAKNADYPRKNWSSLILWNCEHQFHRCLTPGFVRTSTGSFLHRFGWLPDSLIGALPNAWNRLVGEQDGEAKIAHWTLGIPGIEHYSKSAYADEWRATLDRMLRGPAEVSCETLRAA